MKSNFRTLLSAFLLMGMCFSCTPSETSSFVKPEHGYFTEKQASKWEESMLTGNGTIGALVPGNPGEETIILCHEKLFMPEYAPTEAPDLGNSLPKIRELVLNGRSEEAVELVSDLGMEVGISGMIWTDALIPACQMELVPLSDNSPIQYLRSVNYETGEATTNWKTAQGAYTRSIFASRPDGVIATRISSSDGAPISLKLRLTQLPLPESEEEEDEDEESYMPDDLIESVSVTIEGDKVRYLNRFKRQWEGSLKSYLAETKVITSGGELTSDDEWLYIRDAQEVLLLSDIQLSYDAQVPTNTRVDQIPNPSYSNLLDRHAPVQSEMFNRFQLNLGNQERNTAPTEALLESSSFGNLDPALVNQLCEASRYAVISSTGEIPPTLQGIWGGTWRPAWSSDFTLNGNVPSVLASGLNTNLQEVIEAYMDYMWSMYDDFRDNAQDLYGAPGIFVPSRTSSSGKTYHYGEAYPHLLWYAGGAWTAQIFYDYWLYKGNEQFLKEKAIPLMTDAADFYVHILYEDEAGKLNFLPSYSPEVGPMDEHPLSINATMDIAALKQLLRNLISLSEQGYITETRVNTWKTILDRLPAYAIDEEGDLKEWIWPGFENDNAHRHASHLYPLFYEVDPAFETDPSLEEAAITAIEKRLEYRRAGNGAEMAFGLVQKGLAAAHIGDTRHAYECVDWLCNSYWSPAYTSYHDVGEIFNVDICGGLPAVVTEMIVQSSPNEIQFLPALPEEWPDGTLKGAGTRCGTTVDLVWEKGKPVSATFTSVKDGQVQLTFGEQSWDLDLVAGQTLNWEME